ncbi:response regulator [Flavobacterium sp.]|uniref:tetratricopeptide repeat-containing hybrid sensor histidine kinase/response regulator n=1 Tax=Flavobacterium sp. TaxID=239 RepID=UPI003265E00D
MPLKQVFLYLLLLFLGCGNLSIAQNKNFQEVKIHQLISQAWSDFKHSNFEKSLITSRVALNNAVLKGDNYLIAHSYKIIAGNYHELSEFDKAIFFYNKSLQYANKTDNDSIKYSLYNNLGNLYCFEKKQFNKGISYYKKSIAYGLKINDLKQVYFTNVNITWAYFDVGNFTEGFPFLKFINSNQISNGDKSTDIVVNMLNGMYFSHINDNKNANLYFKKAIKQRETIDEQSDLSYAHLEYSKFLTKIKNYKEAYYNLSLFNEITEQLYNEEKLKKASIAGFNLELDEYKREIDKIENEKLIQSQSLKKSKIIVVLFILISLTFLVLIFTLYKNIVIKKKANLELLKAKEIAEEASLLKSQFISTISHELRTPLYGVVGITNMLLEEHKELAKSQYLSSLKFSARYLLTLVNDILQINKIEENKVILENTVFNISDEIKMIKNSLSFLSKKNNNKILVDIDPDIPELLVGDKLRLGQILMNLISNALKFTKNGEITIIVSLVKKEQSNYFIEFQIKDNGIGIAETDQSKVFDEFVQVGRNNEDYQGTGLGLSIVKKLLQLFGSTISLKSKVGTGTSFAFIIPFEHSQEKNKIFNDEIDFDFKSNELYKVLVVEDNLINQLITRKIIEKNNFNCSVADDGFSAIDLLEKEEFDIILMDINMPSMNGFETTRRIRSKGIITPVVALTAFDKDEIAEEALSSGINDIIIKPFEPEKLFKIISELILEEKNVGC